MLGTVTSLQEQPESGGAHSRQLTVCKFRHLLEEHQLGEQILGQVNLHLQAQGVRITTGTIVDATILHAPTSTKNQQQQGDPEKHQIIHTAVATAANVADSAVLPDLYRR